MIVEGISFPGMGTQEISKKILKEESPFISPVALEAHGPIFRQMSTISGPNKSLNLNIQVISPRFER